MVTIDLRQVGRGLEPPCAKSKLPWNCSTKGIRFPSSPATARTRRGGLDEEQIREIQERLGENAAAGRPQADHPPLDRIAGQADRASWPSRFSRPRPPSGSKTCICPSSRRSKRWPRWPARAAWSSLAREISRPRRAAPTWTRGPPTSSTPTARCPPPADALLGAGHILAEQISEQAELRQRLREVLQRTGMLVSSGLLTETKPVSEKEAKPGSRDSRAAGGGIAARSSRGRGRRGVF